LEHNPRSTYESKRRQYLKDIGDTYILNQSRTLYESRAETTQAGGEQNAARAYNDAPLRVHVLRDWIPIAVSVFTFLFLCATVYYTRKQWQTMNKTLCEVRKQTESAGLSVNNAEIFFRADERAWVEIDKVEKADTYPPEPPFATIFKYSFSLKNFGKTVAREVKIHIENFDQDGTFESNKKAIRMTQDSLFKDSKSGKRVIFPNKPGPQSIAPNATFTIPVYSGGQEPRLIGKNYMYGFMVGRIDYVDAFDTQHWVRFCFMIMNAKGEVGHCQYGNEEDNNPEKSPVPR
jgi:hypothetical protein